MAPLLVSFAAIGLAAFESRDLDLPRGAAFACFALIIAATTAAFGVSIAPVAALAIACGLVIEIDRRHQLIPDLLVAAILILSFVMPFQENALSRLAGGAALGALFLAVRTIGARVHGAEALGLGDVKLAAAMGALLGLMDAFMAVALAGAATLFVLMLRRPSAETNRGAPFGIGLAAATAAVALARAAAP